MKLRTLSVALLTAAMPMLFTPVTHAEEEAGWNGSGELGFAMSRGNTRSDNANGKIAFGYEDDILKHDFYLSALRNKSEVTVDVAGEPTRVMETSANRYEIGASSARKLSDRSHIVGSLRYENDDFAPFDYQAILSIGYGHDFIKNERTRLRTEVGPGYRKMRDAVTGQTESDLIGRGLLDFKHKLTETTRFYNVLLVESGSDNTFASNDLGISVSINSRLALKAGFEARRNSKVEIGTKKTDTLTKLNLVYNFM